jgi:serine/threonine protein kinase
MGFHQQPTLPGQPPDNSSPNAHSIPEVVGPYKIENLLEKGGMSILYLGTHPETKDPVTIKVLSQKYLSRPEVVQRFINEAAIIAMSDHPNIVQLHGYGEWEGGFYIAMGFVQGVSLRQYILQTPVSLTRALDIILNIAYALCHLHTHGVIHRDLKPDNILITDAGEIKVIDFGIAQLLADKDSAGAGKQQLVGTPIYMSPEQRENPESVSYPSDIYSLGIIAYELILGRLSQGQIHLTLMPRGMQKILHKALQPNPAERYQDVVDLISDLSEYRNSATLQKDRKPSDVLSELAESMKKVQTTLVTSSSPKWQDVEIGFVGHQGISLSGIYYDFIEMAGGTYGIITGEASAKGAEGVIYTAVLRGMVRSLCRLTTKPVELVTILNDLLLRDSMNQTFTLNYLVLDPQQNQLRYISCGYGSLWQVKSQSTTPLRITANNNALGVSPDVEFSEVCCSWDLDDTVVLNTFATDDSTTGLSEKMFEQALVENISRPPQKQVENIFRRVQLSAQKFLKERSISLVSIHRKSPT